MLVRRAHQRARPRGRHRRRASTSAARATTPSWRCSRKSRAASPRAHAAELRGDTVRRAGGRAAAPARHAARRGSHRPERHRRHEPAENLSRDFPVVGENFTNEAKERWATDFKILLQRRDVTLPATASWSARSTPSSAACSPRARSASTPSATRGHADKFWAVALACQKERGTGPCAGRDRRAGAGVSRGPGSVTHDACERRRCLPKPAPGLCPSRKAGRGQMLQCPGGLPPLAGWPGASPPFVLRGSTMRRHPQALRRPAQVRWRPARGGAWRQLEGSERRPPRRRARGRSERGLRARAVSFTRRARRVRRGRAVTTPDAIHAADERLQTILKAHVVGATVQDPAAAPPARDTASAFTSASALVPPYDRTLCLWSGTPTRCARTSLLRHNIDGSGYRFDAVIDFRRRGRARSKADATITLERLAAREARRSEGVVDDAERRGGLRALRRAAARPRASSEQGSMPSSTSPASTTASSTCAAARARTSRSRATPSGRCFATAGRPRAARLRAVVHGAAAPARSRGGGGHRASTRLAGELRHRALAPPHAPLRAGAVHRVRVLQVVRRSARDLALDGPRLQRHRRAQGCQIRRRPPRQTAHPIHRRARPTACRAGEHAFLRSRLAADGCQLPLYFENKFGAADGISSVRRTHLRASIRASAALHRGEPQGKANFHQDSHPRGRRRGHQ